MRCKICGCSFFAARQRVYASIIVDEDGNFLDNFGHDEAEKPYGPFQCQNCGSTYEELCPDAACETGFFEERTVPIASIPEEDRASYARHIENSMEAKILVKMPFAVEHMDTAAEEIFAKAKAENALIGYCFDNDNAIIDDDCNAEDESLCESTPASPEQETESDDTVVCTDDEYSPVVPDEDFGYDVPVSRLELNTPVGVMWTQANPDEDFPGFFVGITEQDGTDHTLALIEYTESEWSNGYNPRNPAEMRRERAEVPYSRRGEAELGVNGFSVTPGLVCRVWSRYREDEEAKRVFFEDLSEEDTLNIISAKLKYAFIEKKGIHPSEADKFVEQFRSHVADTALAQLTSLLRTKSHTAMQITSLIKNDLFIDAADWWLDNNCPGAYPNDQELGSIIGDLILRKLS